MLRWLVNMLYGSTPAEFKSSVDLEESVRRLREATKRSVFSALGGQAAVGPVQASRVRLQRATPMVGNSFKPFFFGHFEVRGGEVYLSGKFCMLPMVKVFMTFWLAFALLFSVAAALSAMKANSAWFVPLAGIGMFCLGVGFVWTAKHFSRNDVAWLGNVICNALGTPVADRPLGLATASLLPVERSGSPMVLRALAVVLAVMGAMSLIFAYGLPGLVNPGASGAAGLHLHAWPPPAVVAGHGILLLALAVGVYRRELLAWWGGLAYLAAAGCLTVLQTFQVFDKESFAGFPDTIVIKVVFAALSLAVMAIWMRWWYGLRIHFRPSHAGGPIQDT